jgi:hypothetical protein
MYGNTAELIYGPIDSYDVRDWVKNFNLINKKSWVKNFMLNEKHNYEEPYESDDEEGIDIVFDQEFDFYDSKYFDTLTEFLKQYNLKYNFKDLEHGSYLIKIGMRVEDYDKFTEAQKQQVKKFCEKYNLPEPTFYAGII